MGSGNPGNQADLYRPYQSSVISQNEKDHWDGIRDIKTKLKRSFFDRARYFGPGKPERRSRLMKMIQKRDDLRVYHIDDFILDLMSRGLSMGGVEIHTRFFRDSII